MRSVPIPVVRAGVGHMPVARGLPGRWVVAAVPWVAPRRASGVSVGRSRGVLRVVVLVVGVGTRVVRPVGVWVVLVAGLDARIARGVRGGAALVVVLVRRPGSAAIAAVGVGETAASDSMSLGSHDHQQLPGP